MRLLPLTILVVCAALAAAWGSPPPALAVQPAQPWSGKVTEIEDGATLVVTQEGHSERLRLAGVAPPEMDQPWGREAKEFSKNEALGQVVTVEPQGQDHKQRPLAHVILPDGRDLGAEMVKDGLAWHYRRWSKNPLLGDLEKDARDDKRGLWADPRPVPPWEWRSKGGEGSPSSSSKRKRRNH